MKPPKIGAEDHQRDQLRRLGRLICGFANPGGCGCADHDRPLCTNVAWRAEKALEIGQEEAPARPTKRKKTKL